jgi:DNA-directed RNA polymerase I, II, and III subunit RPABC2
LHAEIVLNSTRFNDHFDGGDFTYEDEELEPPPPEEDDAMDGEGQLNHVGDGPSVLHQNGVNGIAAQSNQVIASGDVEAASTKSKAIPPEQRTTTPYMTKYEKARILGTRALQIR